jgi:hypothetical protein
MQICVTKVDQRGSAIKASLPTETLVAPAALAACTENSISTDAHTSITSALPISDKREIVARTGTRDIMARTGTMRTDCGAAISTTDPNKSDTRNSSFKWIATPSQKPRWLQNYSFIDVPDGKERGGGGNSYSNEKEAQAVAR